MYNHTIESPTPTPTPTPTEIMMNQHYCPLLVDFPSNPRQSRSLRVRPSVTFAMMSDLSLYECPESERRSKSYSSKDCKRFQIEAIQDGNRLGAILAARMSSEQVFPEEEGNNEEYETLGIEKMLSLGIAKRSIEHRRYHLNLILSRQATHSANDLGMLSHLSSMPSQKMAQTIASLATAKSTQDSQEIVKRIVVMTTALQNAKSKKIRSSEANNDHDLQVPSSNAPTTGSSSIVSAERKEEINKTQHQNSSPENCKEKRRQCISQMVAKRGGHCFGQSRKAANAA